MSPCICDIAFGFQFCIFIFLTTKELIFTSFFPEFGKTLSLPYENKFLRRWIFLEKISFILLAKIVIALLPFANLIYAQVPWLRTEIK